MAIAGAGGKTSLAFRLAREARAAGVPVVVTSTTHMGAPDGMGFPPLLLAEEGGDGSALDRALEREGWALLLGRALRPDKIQGLSAEAAAGLVARAPLVLVEADGARGRSLKVPNADEPVVPPGTTCLIVLAALDVLGRPLDDERVHRVVLVCEAVRQAAGSLVREETVSGALLYPAGYACRAPRAARLCAFLNKAEDAASLAAAARIARTLAPTYGCVLAGSARGGAGQRLA